MLTARGDWVLLGNADEGKPVAEGWVEAGARDAGNPMGGYYCLRKAYRGRFANYAPPLMERLGLAEVEHIARNNRMRALQAMMSVTFGIAGWNMLHSGPRGLRFGSG